MQKIDDTEDGEISEEVTNEYVRFIFIRFVLDIVLCDHFQIKCY